MKKKKRAAPSGLGCLFWAALVVVLVAVALAVREPVVRNVRALFGRTEEPATATTTDAGGTTPATDHATPAPQASRPAAPAAGTPAAATPAAPETVAPSTASPAAATPPAATPAAKPPAARTRTARLWFAKVDDEGAIALASAERTLPVGDAPLRDSLSALLSGPTAAERGAGLVTFVPPGTAVRSVTVKGDTAFIDFSEQFRYGTLGVEGQRAQLRQVVWAATEFSTVARVQVLIEGRRVDYLGPEGVAVGSPLGRDSSFE